jgi:hypothetical protein
MWEADFSLSRGFQTISRDECRMNSEARGGSGAVQ